jgi:serine/threonine protein kinase
MGNAQQKVQEDNPFVDELEPGTELSHGQFKIEEFLNSGGFGITYLAKDSLERRVVIKECFPSSFCHRSGVIVQPRSQAHKKDLKSVVDLFVQEARSLAKLEHPNIVGVHQVFEDNSTAYMALDFVEGRDLLDILEDDDHELTAPQIKGILKDVLGAIGYIHEQDILHRDISPDNILLDGDLRPVLIDFGAAREEATKKSRVMSELRVVKDGYSPQEFYIQGSPQTPSSDLYALGATFYHLISGEVPANSQTRLAAIASGEKDPYSPLADRVKGYDKKFLSAIDKALAILPKDRLQSAQEWMDSMEGIRRKSRIMTTALPMSSAAAETIVAEQKRKSKVIPLLATVAGIAILAGGALIGTGMVELPVGVGASIEQSTTKDSTKVAADDAAQIAAPSATENVDEAATNAATPKLAARAPVTPSAEPVAEVKATRLEAVQEPQKAPTRINTVRATNVLSAWSLELPFEGKNGSNVISNVDPVAPAWAREGVTIVAVNGMPIEHISDISKVLRNSTEPSNGPLQPLTFTLQPIGATETIQQKWQMPIIQETLLLNGASFLTRHDGDTWTTVVTSLPEGQSKLNIGDRLIASVDTSESLDGRTSFRDVLERGIRKGQDQFNFAVSRDDTTFLVTLNYSGAV